MPKRPSCLPTLLALFVLPAAGCLDTPGFDRDPAPSGEGEGEGPAEGEGEGTAEGEGEGAAEGEGEGPAEGEGEGPAEGEGEGPAEGEGEGAAEGEGEQPPGPQVVQIAELEDFDAAIRRVAFTWDNLEVAAYVPSGTVYFYALADTSIVSRRARVDDTEDNALFSDFALSPTLPLAVTRAGGLLQGWALDQPGRTEYFGSYEAEAHRDIRFGAAGDQVVFLRDGAAVIARVAGGLATAWEEPEQEARMGQQVDFVGPDDWLVVIENPRTGHLRLRPNPDYEGPLTPSAYDPAECNDIVAISGAHSVDKLAFLCGDGRAHVTPIARGGTRSPSWARCCPSTRSASHPTAASWRPPRAPGSTSSSSRPAAGRRCRPASGTAPTIRCWPSRRTTAT